MESLDSCATNKSKGGMERRSLESQLSDRARVRLGVVPEASGPAIGAWLVEDDPSSAIFLIYMYFELIKFWGVADQIRNNKDILLGPQQRQSFGVYSFAIQLMQRRSVP